MVPGVVEGVGIGLDKAFGSLVEGYELVEQPFPLFVFPGLGELNQDPEIPGLHFVQFECLDKALHKIFGNTFTRQYIPEKALGIGKAQALAYLGA
jgi:hypothetical protein